MVKGKSIFTSFAFSTAYAPYAPYALKYERVKYERVKVAKAKVMVRELYSSHKNFYFWFREVTLPSVMVKGHELCNHLRW